jgi:hypothetical protein
MEHLVNGRILEDQAASRERDMEGEECDDGQCNGDSWAKFPLIVRGWLLL